MPKMKTRRAVAKRFKMTANGKLKRSKVGLRHRLEHHSSSLKRELGKATYVHASDYRKTMRCLPYGIANK